ncbi:MAG: sigma-70 family RNA polymerase sigma factor [Candidatus Omnitrophica bacterium]|nr:sigma-70 family RNA polymerase sigma factor [Candidatus Omnitrophota bacterium]
MEYENLVDRLSPKIKAISRKVNRRYSYCDENDFYQEAILHLWMQFQQGGLREKTDSYILQGCYYFLKNYIRKLCKSVDNNSVSIYSVIDENGLTIEDTIASGAYIAETESVEIYLLLDESEERFTEREKNIFYYQLEGFTTREIGEKIGVSHVMVVKTGSRIRQKCTALREELI